MRYILHCDLNNFFASVECLKNPNLKNVPMAVSGDPKKRHGVILAKNDIAKRYGIYTPETVYSALKKCPGLVLVESHHDEYIKYSKLVNEIYLKYTDRVEPASIDESYLDITESTLLFGKPIDIAYRIKEEVKNTLGLTISVGVSFNKVLAKMGSDMKKPDAVTVLSPSNFKEKLYPLPVENLIFVGKSLANSLKKIRIKTIGDLANYDKKVIEKKFGKNGLMAYNFANGIDSDYVQYYNKKHIPKSISKGYTFPKDINDKKILIGYAKKIVDEIAEKLRKEKLNCRCVSIALKDSNLISVSKQKIIEKTDLFQDITCGVLDLLNKNYTSGNMIRAITIGVTNLESDDEPIQINFFDEYVESGKSLKLENVTNKLDELKNIYGKNIINFASVLNDDSNMK